MGPPVEANENVAYLNQVLLPDGPRSLTLGVVKARPDMTCRQRVENGILDPRTVQRQQRLNARDVNECGKHFEHS